MRKAIIYLLFVYPLMSYGQKNKHTPFKLTLEEVVRMAIDSSLAAFKAKNLYRASYWEYRSYLAEKKPSLALNSYPVYYTSALTKRYNSNLDIDEYRQQQSVYTYASTSLSQALPFCGGTLSLNSEVARLQNFGGEAGYTQFTTVPIKIALDQPLFGFNEFKWKRKIEPLKYEKAKRIYLQSVETISLKVLEYYFDLLAAQINVDMAKTNQASTDTLYNIGKKRLEIASITQAEALTLKVEALIARNALAKANKELQGARFSFYSYLKINNNEDIKLILPDSLPGLQVSYDLALTQALEHNPDLIDYRQQVLESEEKLEKTRREGLMDASLSVSYGLNQQGENLPEAYNALLDQQNIVFTFSIPIIDWGQRKGEYNMAKSNYEVVNLTAEQAETDFQQQVIQAVSNFIMQEDVVNTAYETKMVAQQAYNSVKQHFLIGKADVNTLSLALERQDVANLNYIESLRSYWQYYYTLRLLTLFDFENNISLMEQFDDFQGVE
jgi:outer membrane protein TolC